MFTFPRNAPNPASAQRGILKDDNSEGNFFCNYNLLMHHHKLSVRVLMCFNSEDNELEI